MRRFLFLIALMFTANVSAQVTTAFTYQGALEQSGAPANGSFDFRFALYDTSSAGVPFAGPISVDDVPVDEGVFSTPVDFGMDLFGVMDLWLEVRVRDGGSTGAFTVLSPRQLITPAPLALHAQNVEPGAVGSQQIAGDSVGAAEAVNTEIQFRIDGQCSADSAIRSVGPDGSVTCEPTSGLSLPFFGSVSTSNPAFEIQNTGTGEGVRVSGAGNDGINVIQAQGSGVRVADSGGDGLRVLNAGDSGLDMSNSADEGIRINSPGKAGIDINGPGLDGININSPASDGINISGPADVGMNISSTGSEGIDISTTGGDGIDISGAGGHGIDIAGAGENGIDITGAHHYGLTVAASPDRTAAAFTGNDDRVAQAAIVEIENQGDGHGLFVGPAGGSGIIVDSATTGIQVRNTGQFGIWMPDTQGDGINIPPAGDDALEVSGIQHGIIANGDADGNGDGLAGIFNGDVWVNGTLSKASGAFRIDHPLDPAGKYLQHSFVESPEMMNVYNGNVTLDSSGRATVELPEYFEALNRDFRFQLTPIGGPAPHLHFANQIENNSFSIAGGAPGMKVSWQVTGVRQDAWAEKNRIAVEVDKPKTKQGTYLHPQVHEQPVSKAEGLLEMGEDHRKAILKARAGHPDRAR